MDKGISFLPTAQICKGARQSGVRNSHGLLWECLFGRLPQSSAAAHDQQSSHRDRVAIESLRPGSFPCCSAGRSRLRWRSWMRVCGPACRDCATSTRTSCHTLEVGMISSWSCAPCWRQCQEYPHRVFARHPANHDRFAASIMCRARTFTIRATGDELQALAGTPATGLVAGLRQCRNVRQLGPHLPRSGRTMCSSPRAIPPGAALRSGSSSRGWGETQGADFLYAPASGAAARAGTRELQPALELHRLTWEVARHVVSIAAEDGPRVAAAAAIAVSWGFK